MTTPAPKPLALVLEERLSAERLGSYRRAVGGALTEALRLYRWNMAISAAFYENLGVLEVVLRNAVDHELTTWHHARHGSGKWWDDPAGVLEPARHDDVAVARGRVHRNPVTHGRVLAELNFGFWRFLLASRYENTLWTPALRHAFPNLKPARRSLVGDRVERLNRFRNRVAHHEPVHHLPLFDRHEDMLFVLDAICVETGQWVRRTSRVQSMLALKP